MSTTVGQWRTGGAVAGGRSAGVEGSVADRSAAVAGEVAGRFADEVDARARFPRETLAALAASGVLGALVPRELGGEGADLTEACQSVLAVGRHCASSAMVLAMHHLQVACLVRHCGGSPGVEGLLRRVAGEELLLASATSEVGIGGRMRQSSCAVEPSGDGFTLVKQAPTVSYGAQADAVLVTARRTADSAPGDQVLVACVRPDVTLEQVTEWDTLGLRGTCSPGFVVRAQGSWDMVLPEPFADIAAATMLPYSHLLWSHVWLGIASAATARAGALVRRQARKDPGVTPPAARRLAELWVVLQQLEHLVTAAVARFDEDRDGHRADGLTDAVSLNGLKVGASSLMVDVVGRALAICGMDGYRNGTPFSLGRHLRDAHGAVVMVSNDRILGDNAQMLLVAKEGV
ncbi:MAG TPA: acyl-CoA dehydrogenase family protein [Acidimicrobiales bacterium]|nr:acyl-CoA dehydrogenase family protein [Acidimicrobiales bacterium]